MECNWGDIDANNMRCGFVLDCEEQDATQPAEDFRIDSVVCGRRDVYLAWDARALSVCGGDLSNCLLFSLQTARRSSIDDQCFCVDYLCLLFLAKYKFQLSLSGTHRVVCVGCVHQNGIRDE